MAIEADYYRVLGVPARASHQEIRHAYRQLVRQYHPDANRPTADRERFIQVQEAYEVLSDRRRRRAYDQWRESKGLATPPALRLEITQSHEKIPALDEPQRLYTYVEILPNPQAKTPPLPLNVCLVIDCSTSMQGESLSQVKQATQEIITILEQEELFSLVTFSDRALVLCSHCRGQDRSLAYPAINAMKAQGGTEIYQGLKAGVAQVRSLQPQPMLNHVILLTDGQTYGDEAECLALARQARRQHIGISTFGIGTDWNDSLLDEIAKLSGGTSAFIKDSHQITQAFDKHIRNMQTVFARDLECIARHDSDIQLDSVFQVLPSVRRLERKGNRIFIGSAGTQAPTALLFDWIIQPHAVGTHQISSLTFQGQVRRRNHLETDQAIRDISLRFVTGNTPSTSVPPEIIIKSLERLSALRLQEKAVQDLDAACHHDATRHLRNLATRLLSMGEAQLAQAALSEAQRIAQTGRLSAGGHKALKYGTRRLVGSPVHKEP